MCTINNFNVVLIKASDYTRTRQASALMLFNLHIYFTPTTISHRIAKTPCHQLIIIACCLLEFAAM